MTGAGVGNPGEWVQAGTGNGPATSTMAVPERREAVALDAGRRHGKDVPPRSPLRALRSFRARQAALATGFAGIGPILFGLCPSRFRLRSAELGPVVDCFRLALFIHQPVAVSAGYFARRYGALIPRV